MLVLTIIKGASPLSPLRSKKRNNLCHQDYYFFGTMITPPPIVILDNKTYNHYWWRSYHCANKKSRLPLMWARFPVFVIDFWHWSGWPYVSKIRIKISSDSRYALHSKYMFTTPTTLYRCYSVRLFLALRLLLIKFTSSICVVFVNLGCNETSTRPSWKSNLH